MSGNSNTIKISVLIFQFRQFHIVTALKYFQTQNDLIEFDRNKRNSRNEKGDSEIL